MNENPPPAAGDPLDRGPKNTARGGGSVVATRVSRGPLRLGRKILYALLPTLLLLSILEVSSRLVCKSRFAPYRTNISIQGNSRWAAEPALIWTNRPRYLEYDRSSQYNEHGMRVEPGEIELPPARADELRVFCLGGSTMAGVGSSQEGDWLKMTGLSSHPVADSIDGHLERILQDSFPGRNVRVYNAAVSGFALAQSHLMYERLKHLEPDWIISLDGVNEPTSLEPGETAQERLRIRWENHPVNRFPFRQARFLMSRSAFFFLAGELAFFRAGIIRNPGNTEQDPEVLAFWLRKGAHQPPDRAGQDDAGETRAVDAFFQQLEAFRRALLADGQKHLLLIQPHLSLRNPGKMTEIERGLYNYYTHTDLSSGERFIKTIHATLAARFPHDGAVFSIRAAHEREGWFFLDYCHLTSEANRLIATELAERILHREGDSAPTFAGRGGGS